MALLEVDNVRQCFGGVVALDRVSFKVTEGQITAIIGPNGAGKTTLLNVVSGIFRRATGSIHFNGNLISGLAPFEIAALGLSRTFQNVSLFLHMSVLENVMMGRHHRTRAGLLACAFRSPRQRREEQAIRQTALAELENVGLADKASRGAGALSFGQRRMVELARSLATQPKLLLLDEPASGLNTKETDDLAMRIRRIRDQGITILLVEHDMSLVMDLADNIVALHFGTPIAQGPPAVIQNDAKVISVYLGERSSAA